MRSDSRSHPTANTSSVLVLYKIVNDGNKNNGAADSDSSLFNAFTMPLVVGDEAEAAASSSGSMVTLEAIQRNFHARFHSQSNHSTDPLSAPPHRYHWRICIPDTPAPGEEQDDDNDGIICGWWDIADTQAPLPVLNMSVREVSQLLGILQQQEETRRELLMQGRKSTIHHHNKNNHRHHHSLMTDVAAKAKGAFASFGKALHAQQQHPNPHHHQPNLQGTAASVGGNCNQEPNEIPSPTLQVVVLKLLDLAKIRRKQRHNRSSSFAHNSHRHGRNHRNQRHDHHPQQGNARQPDNNTEQVGTDGPNASQPLEPLFEEPLVVRDTKEVPTPPLTKDWFQTPSPQQQPQQPHDNTPQATSDFTSTAVPFPSKNDNNNIIIDFDLDPIQGKGSATTVADENSPPFNLFGMEDFSKETKEAEIDDENDNISRDEDEKIQSAIQTSRDRQDEQAAQQLQEDEVRKRLEPRVKAWCEEQYGQRKQLRALLASLDKILWPGAKWKPVSLGDILDEKDCSKCYKKASLLVHPDRTHQLDAEQRFLAKRIFNALSQAKADLDIGKQ